MATEKSRARDEGGKIITVPQPDHRAVIDPYVFIAAKTAVNYDLRFGASLTLGSGDQRVIGIWVSTPWQRKGHGPLCEALLKQLRALPEDDPRHVSWPDNAFLWTQAQGIQARQKYVEMVCEGKLKANKGSWGPNPDRAEDKSRFRFMVPEDLAKAAGLEYEMVYEENDDEEMESTHLLPMYTEETYTADEKGNYDPSGEIQTLKRDFDPYELFQIHQQRSDGGWMTGVHVPYDSLVKAYPELYKTAPTYVPKPKKIELVQQFFASKLTGGEGTASAEPADVLEYMATQELTNELVAEIASQTKLNPSDVIKTIKEMRTGTNGTAATAAEPVESKGAAPTLDFESFTMPDDVEASSEDEITPEQVAAAEAAAELGAEEIISEHPISASTDEDDEEELELEEHSTEVAVAAAVATEETITTIADEPETIETSVREMVHAIDNPEQLHDFGTTQFAYHTVNPKNLKTLMVRTFSDAETRNVGTAEAVSIGEKGKQEIFYYCFVPELKRSEFCREGMNYFGGLIDGAVRVIAVELTINDVGERRS